MRPAAGWTAKVHPAWTVSNCFQPVPNGPRSLEQTVTTFRDRWMPCSSFALSVRVSSPLLLAVVGILPLVIWLADLLPPLAGMA
jgi:hypothetical protein